MNNATKSMTFREFQATAKEVDHLDDDLRNLPAITYLDGGLHISKVRALLIVNESLVTLYELDLSGDGEYYLQDDLRPLERKLFHWACRQDVINDSRRT